jgi:hypothetical protein
MNPAVLFSPLQRALAFSPAIYRQLVIIDSQGWWAGIPTGMGMGNRDQ